MLVRNLATVAVVFFSFSGCLAATRPTGTQDGSGNSELLDPASDLRGANISIEFADRTRWVPGISWAEFGFSAAGGPGAWLLIYQPFPRDLVAYNLNYEASVVADTPKGEPLGVLFVPPMVVYDFMSDQYEPGATIGQRALLHLERGGGHFEKSEKAVILGETGLGRLPGVFFALGSTGAWRVEISVKANESGVRVIPQHVAGGDGARVFFDAKRAAEVSSPAERLVLDVTVPTRGWSHQQVVHGILGQVSGITNGPSPVRPDYGVRTYDVRFPNGFSRVGWGYNYGASSGHHNYFGTFHGSAGPFHSEYLFLETDLDRDLALLHFPTEEGSIPENFVRTGYCENLC